MNRPDDIDLFQKLMHYSMGLGLIAPLFCVSEG